MEYATIDRFEEEFAILELPDRTTIAVPRAELPEGAKEGDLLTAQPPYTLQPKETEERAEKVKSLMDKLWE